MNDLPASRSTATTEAESFDQDRLAEQVFIERERPGFSAMILDHFESHWQASLKQLQQAAAAQDRQLTRRIIHRLHGCAASFGATRLTARLKELQGQLKAAPRILSAQEILHLRHAGTRAAAGYRDWLNQ